MEGSGDSGCCRAVRMPCVHIRAAEAVCLVDFQVHLDPPMHQSDWNHQTAGLHGCCLQVCCLQACRPHQSLDKAPADIRRTLEGS